MVRESTDCTIGFLIFLSFRVHYLKSDILPNCIFFYIINLPRFLPLLRIYNLNKIILAIKLFSCQHSRLYIIMIDIIRNHIIRSHRIIEIPTSRQQKSGGQRSYTNRTVLVAPILARAILDVNFQWRDP